MFSGTLAYPQRFRMAFELVHIFSFTLPDRSTRENTHDPHLSFLRTCELAFETFKQVFFFFLLSISTS